MARSRKIIAWGAGIVLGIVLLVLVGVLLLGRTEWGTRQVGVRAVAYLNDQMAGDLRVGSVSGGGILRGVTLHEVVLEDSLGNAFLRADSARLSYAIRSFLGGDVVLNNVEVWGPIAIIERLPGDSVWNFERAFADPQPDPAEDRPETSDPLVVLERARIHDGTVTVRVPWEPDEGQAVQPADTADLMLEPAAGGLVRVIRLDDMNAELPRILISSPAGQGRIFTVANLSTRAYVWKTPIELERLGGTVAIRDSLLSFDVGELRLPDSRASGVGRVILGDTLTFDVELDVDELSVSDLAWLYDDLPPDGRLEGRLRLQRRADGSTVVLARDLDLSAPGTRVRGAFGVILGDTLSFTDVDLHADPLDLDYIGRLIPGGLPFEGLMIGDLRIEGPISSLHTEGDVRLVDNGHTSQVRWSGEVDLRAPYAVRNLDVAFENLDPALVARIAPESLDPDYPLSGRVLANGSPSGRLRVRGALDLAGRTAPIGHVEATVTLDAPRSGRRRLDVDVRTTDFALEEVERWVPSLSVLRGRATGPVRLVFDGDSMTLDADVTPVGGGRLTLDGVFSREPQGGFTLAGTLTDVQVGEVLESLPSTRASGTFGVEHDTGAERTRIIAELSDGEFARLPIRTARMVGSLAGGVLFVDTALVQTAAARVAALGRIGIDSTSSGALRVRAVGDSLGALAPMLGLSSDSMLAGAGEFDGVIEGNTYALRLEGTGRLLNARAATLSADAADYSATMVWARGARPAAEVTMAARGALLADRRLGDVRVQASIDPELRGRIDLAVNTPFEQRYELTADYNAHDDTTDIFVERVVIADGDQHWELSAPTVLRMAPAGSRLQGLELVERGGGTIEVAGYVPWRAPWAPASLRPARAVDLLGDAQAAPIGALVRVVDPESSLRGVLSGRLRVRGTADAPSMSADGHIAAVRYQDVLLDTLHVRLRHQDHVSFWEVDAQRDGADMLTGHLSLPMQVAFVPFRVERLDLPMSGRIRADRMPAALPAGLVSGLQQVSGMVSGELTLGGTPFDPELGGGFTLSDADFTLAATNVRYSNVGGTLTVTGTQDLGVDVRGETGDGHLQISGTIRLDRPDDPAFALRLEASNMVVARRRDLEATASGYADLAGRYRSPLVTGRLQVVDGALHLDELLRQARVVTLENPLLVDVIDTTQIAVQRILRRSRSAFLEGLELRVQIDVPGNLWVRSEELNVETAGNVELRYDPASHNLQMFGQVNAVRGFYNVRLVLDLPVRRFQVRDGSINFVGVPGIDPNLDITAVYRARTQNSDLLEILAVVDGTMRNPRVRLTSDSDPPISESDLASYLIFGRPTYALSSSESQFAQNAFGAIASNAVGFGAPVLFGLVTSEVEALGSAYGLFDYFSITNEDLVRQLQQQTQANAPMTGFFAGTRLEIGRYFADEWFIAFSAPLSPVANGAAGDDLAWTPGGRVEWRFHPTWNAQVFWENRVAQAATRGFDPTLQETSVMGVFLAREWGY